MLSLTVYQKKAFSNIAKDWWQAKVPSPMGIIDVIGFDENIFGVGFDGQTAYIQRYLYPKNIIYKQLHLTFDQLMKFKRIATIGTTFQATVWQAMLEIPLHDRQTYSEIARKINHPTALRAVGTAVGANPIAILIPCHRVGPKAGGLGNYYWGKAIKNRLLQIEKNSTQI